MDIHDTGLIIYREELKSRPSLRSSLSSREVYGAEPLYERERAETTNVDERVYIKERERERESDFGQLAVISYMRNWCAFFF